MKYMIWRAFLIFMILNLFLLGGAVLTFKEIKSVAAGELFPTDLIAPQDNFKIILHVDKTRITAITYSYEFAD